MSWTERFGGSCLLAGIGVTSFDVNAAPWKEDQAFFTENASLASSKVDAADLDGDGFIDLVFANGGGFDKGDVNSDLPQQAFFNNAGIGMTDVSAAIFGGQAYNGRAVKLRDVDHDGHIDIILGTTWATQTQLFMNDGLGNFTNETATNLPQGTNSIGDIEVGDIDGDGDLDMLLADWGDESPVSQGAGGITKLWRQIGEPAKFGAEGTAMFEDVTLGQMPNIGVRWSWDVEFVDVDNDFDLDIMVSSYASDTVSVVLFVNDGQGDFKDMTAGNVAQGKYALDIEPMDLDGDSFLDLVTLHDGVSGRNRVLLNNQAGGFIDATGPVWPQLENPPSLDFMAAFHDHDSDAKVDIVLGALQTVTKYPDRLMLSQAGKLKQWDDGQLPKYQAFQEEKASPGTYALVLADLNKDNRLDVVMAQNENAFDKKVLIADAVEVLADTAPPIFVNYEKLGVLVFGEEELLRVRCHDNKSPLMLHDFTGDGGLPYLEYWVGTLPADLDVNAGDKSDPGQWYGEYLWRINFAVPDADKFFYRVCAKDAAGNEACTPVEQTDIEGGGESESDTMSGMNDTETTVGGTTVGVTITGSDSVSVGTVSGTEPTGSSTSSGTAGVSATDSMGEPTESSLSGSSSGSQNSTGESTTGSGQYLPGEGCGCHSDVGSSLVGLGLLPLLFRRRRLRARITPGCSADQPREGRRVRVRGLRGGAAR